MKTTCLFAALSGLAMAQEPAPVMPVQGVPAVPAVPAVPGMGALELAEPLKWTFDRAQGRFHDVVLGSGSVQVGK